MLLNSDALEAEKKLQEARELDAFNQAWDRIHGVNDKTPSQASAGFRTYDQTLADKQFFPLSDLQRSKNIITNSTQNLNPNSQTIRNKLSYNAWLEELKRKRRRRGMF